VLVQSKRTRRVETDAQTSEEVRLCSRPSDHRRLALLWRRHASLGSRAVMSAVNVGTTAPRTRISRPDTGSAKCNASKPGLSSEISLCTRLMTGPPTPPASIACKSLRTATPALLELIEVPEIGSAAVFFEPENEQIVAARRSAPARRARLAARRRPCSLAASRPRAGRPSSHAVGSEEVPGPAPPERICGEQASSKSPHDSRRPAVRVDRPHSVGGNRERSNPWRAACQAMSQRGIMN
jgi:hypothetical protein